MNYLHQNVVNPKTVEIVAEVLIFLKVLPWRIMLMTQ